MFYDSNHVHDLLHLTGAVARAIALRQSAEGCAGVMAPMAAQRASPAPERRRRLAAALGCAALAVTLGVPALAQADATGLERKIKAAFLYRFLAYTEFPASAFANAAAPLVIGVVDADQLATELGRLVTGRTVKARRIAVKVFREHETPFGVHLLFVGGTDHARVRSVLTSAPAAPMLLVTEAVDGLQQGSVINFKVVDQRVRFDVSLQAAARNSITLSSRLLTVANHVIKGAP